MVTPTTAFAAAFLLLCIAFAVGITWASLREAHGPASRRPDTDDDAG